MNYGKFFRLNKNLSRIEDGFAIYDYIDLPAYFAPSMDNKMSPKHPISLMITSSSVIFRLHYSAYKITKEKDKKYPKYYYDYEITDDLRKDQQKVKPGDTTKIAHMEEVVLELPYMNTLNKNLADTIKSIYNTEFPQKITDKEDDKIDGISGRYLEKLIRKRYLEENVEEEKDIHSHLYHSLRRISDGTPSYSTLWLMGLVVGEKDDVHYIRTDKKGNVVGFLRKLLLDFMFDLKHSDVFQNSAYYQNMYSGLMSDFFFSALMHKCEYYYYRVLVTEEIKKFEDSEITDDDKERILYLYANDLRISEELWTQDIMSPNAEKYFEYSNDKKKDSGFCNSYWEKILLKCQLIEMNQLVNRDSWFAEPEEEMRRVCFPMDERDDNEKLIKVHICNAKTILDHFIINGVGGKYKEELIDSTERNREVISRWFLKRYDFNDVCHLHLSRKANSVSFVPFLICILFFALWPSLSEKLIGTVNLHPWLPTLFFVIFFGFIALLFQQKSREYKLRNRNLLNKHIEKNSQRIVNFMIILIAFIIAINYFYYFLAMMGVVVFFLFLKSGMVKIKEYLRHITSYLHLLFPRLVASITTAWLTMSLGFDLYAAFFDKHVSWPTAIMIVVIVFVFVMYELNRVTQRCDIWKKIVRSIQLVTISYGISLVVGSIVIDFLGRQYMERGGPYDDRRDFIMQYYPGTATLSAVPFDELPADKQVEVMENVRCEKGCRSIQVFHLGEHEVFFMRDFLIMFSFVTMFMGVFLQMFIFDEKKMTEF